MRLVATSTSRIIVRSEFMTSEIDMVDVVEREIGRISELIRGCDLTTPVDHLGRWKVRDVVAHLGGVHRWAARIVDERSMDGPGATKPKLDGEELLDWFDAGAEQLVTTLRSADQESDCPNFNPGSANVVAWWSRRQAHETTVHRWDMEKALGCTTPIAAAVAADGIDEFLDVFVRTRGKQTLTAPITLNTTEPPRSWTLTLATKPGRLDVDVGGEITADTTLAGEPEQLLLVLWGRLGLGDTDIVVTGDSGVAESLVP